MQSDDLNNTAVLLDFALEEPVGKFYNMPNDIEVGCICSLKTRQSVELDRLWRLSCILSNHKTPTTKFVVRLLSTDDHYLSKNPDAI